MKAKKTWFSVLEMAKFALLVRNFQERNLTYKTNSDILNSNLFDPTDSNIEEANTEENLFDQSDDEDKFI